MKINEKVVDIQKEIYSLSKQKLDLESKIQKLLLKEKTLKLKGGKNVK